MTSLTKFFFRYPSNLDDSKKKEYQVALMGVYLAFCLHSIWLCIFFYQDITPLFYFNIFSISTFVFNAFLMHTRGMTNVVMLISALEVTAHQLVAVHYLGWDMGFQYYVLAVVSYIFMGHFRSILVPIAISAVSLVAFYVMYFTSHGENVVIRYEVSETLTDIFLISNVFCIFFIIGIFAQLYSSIARRYEVLLQLEHKKSDSLLLNVLPASISERLKGGEKYIADHYEEASVLFADMVGFTEFSRGLEPVELIVYLNEYFRAFDKLTEKYGLEKIKTIGDAYMIVGGAPDKCEDHAIKMVNLALDMIDATKKISGEQDIAVEIRIGINSGPIVAGVIGNKKYIYDIWGDTVNIASRMESHSIPSMVQVAEDTRKLLDDSFIISERGEIAFKGLGTRKAYFIEGRVGEDV